LDQTKVGLFKDKDKKNNLIMFNSLTFIRNGFND